MTNQLPPAENSTQFKQFIITQPTLPISTITPSTKTISKRHILALALVALFAIVLFVIWHTLSQSTSPSALTTHTLITTIPTSTTIPNTTNSITTEIQVYIVGAVKHPGVYTLPASARVYQLVQAAGGPLANANLVTLNLAAKLSDGQEIYVSAIGETSAISSSNNPTSPTNPTNPTNSTLVNINTASVDDLRQNLHLSQVSAQNIVTYRVEHGNFTSIDQLLQVVSKAIYNKIKTQVTI